MINNLLIPNIRIFVFGTLRAGGRLDYYMEGTTPLGLHYTRGQLMQSTIGSAYINFDNHEAGTIGEVYNVNYYCLQRINHLESTSGEFPRGYDLDLIPVWSHTDGNEFNFKEDSQTLAFFYRRRNHARPIVGGDWVKRKRPIEEIGKFLESQTEHTIYHSDVIKYMETYFKS